MPIPENVARVHLNWALGTTELAVTTFHMQLQHGAGLSLNWDDASNALAKKAAQKLIAAWTDKSLLGAGVSLRDVSVYHLAADTGRTLNKGQFVCGGPDVLAGTGGPTLPWECALAVSLYAYQPGQFVANRASMRGRFYLPPLSTGIMAAGGVASGRLNPNGAAAIADFMGAYLNDMHHTSNGDDSGPLGGSDWWSLGVLSRKRGEFHRVTTIRLGDVMDVQRRRRNATPEAYIERPISDS